MEQTRDGSRHCTISLDLPAVVIKKNSKSYTVTLLYLPVLFSSLQSWIQREEGWENPVIVSQGDTFGCRGRSVGRSMLFGDTNSLTMEEDMKIQIHSILDEQQSGPYNVIDTNQKDLGLVLIYSTEKWLNKSLISQTFTVVKGRSWNSLFYYNLFFTTLGTNKWTFVS